MQSLGLPKIINAMSDVIIMNTEFSPFNLSFYCDLESPKTLKTIAYNSWKTYLLDYKIPVSNKNYYWQLRLDNLNKEKYLAFGFLDKKCYQENISLIDSHYYLWQNTQIGFCYYLHNNHVYNSSAPIHIPITVEDGDYLGILINPYKRKFSVFHNQKLLGGYNYNDKLETMIPAISVYGDTQKITLENPQI